MERKINKEVIIFCGASGTGKSTLLKKIEDKYGFPAIEISARKFLDTTKGSYDEQMNDKLQSQIIYNNTVQTAKYINAPLTRSVCLSRSIVDCIAYSHVLKSGEYLCSIAEDYLQYIKNRAIFIYLPIEFSLSKEDEKDIARGMNEEVRQATDKEIKRLLEKYDIFHYKITGSVQERMIKLGIIFNTLNMI